MTIVFVGDNAYARERAVREYVTQFVERHGDMAIDRFDGAEIAPPELASIVSALPFLTDRRMVIVRGYAENKALLEAVELVVSAVADTTDLVLVETSIDGRSKAYKFLQKNTDFRVFHTTADHELGAWIVQHFAQYGAVVSMAVAQHLLDRVGPSQQLLSREIEKVCLYSTSPTIAEIDEIVEYMPTGSVFAMLDTVFAGKTTESLRLYEEQRAQGMDPYALLGMLVWQLHALAVVKVAGQLPPAEIAATSKLSPYVIRKNQAVVRGLTLVKLKSMIHDTLELDRILKTISVDPDDALKTLIVSFAR